MHGLSRKEREQQHYGDENSCGLIRHLILSDLHLTALVKSNCPLGQMEEQYVDIMCFQSQQNELFE